MRLLVFCVITAALALADGAIRPAQGQSAGTGPRETLTVLSGPSYRPYADGEEGLASEIVRAAFTRMGIAVKLETLPWARGFGLVAEGRADATYPYMITPERRRVVLFSAPLIEIRQVVFQARDRARPVSTVADLAGRSVCSPLGYALPDEVQALVAAGRLSRVSPGSLAQCVALVRSGRADLFVEDELVGWSALRDVGAVDQIVASPQAVLTSTLHLVVGRSHAGAEDLLVRFDRALEELRRDGSLQRLRERYTGGS